MDCILKRHNVSLNKLLSWVGLPQSSYYYKASNKRKGAKPSSYTIHKTKGLIDENRVVTEIKSILSHEFIDCGYHIMTGYLKKAGYIINHKKVYRIMEQNGLLKANARISRNPGGKKYVRYRKVNTSHPMQCLEMDIKMVWIPNKGKNAYLLSVIDVHTRKILGYKFDWNMKQDAVIELLSEIIEIYGIATEMIIRSDNGSQFIANSVREYIALVGIDQEFTHVATPEENAHIESYHGTLKRDIFDRFDYNNFGQIQQIIKRYVKFYNQERLHGKIGKVTPDSKWEKDQKLIPKKMLAA